MTKKHFFRSLLSLSGLVLQLLEVRQAEACPTGELK
jgi:hypothetical protein